MRFFIASKKGTKHTDSPSVESLAPEVNWIKDWDSLTNKDVRLGEISEESYPEAKSKLKQYFDVYEDIQFTTC